MVTALDIRPAPVAVRRNGPLTWVFGVLLALFLVGSIVALGMAVDRRDVPQALQPTLAVTALDRQVDAECTVILPTYDQDKCVTDLPIVVAQDKARYDAASTFGVVHFGYRAAFLAADLVFVAGCVAAFGGYLAAERRNGGLR